MFVDASAILTCEADADDLANALDTACSPITSPIAVFGAALGICRKLSARVAEAQADVSDFLGTPGVRTFSITGDEAEATLDAFPRYGKGRGHPAQLNLGYCFAYAVAKTYRTALLFNGGDFLKTDTQLVTVAGKAESAPTHFESKVIHDICNRTITSDRSLVHLTTAKQAIILSHFSSRDG